MRTAIQILAPLLVLSGCPKTEVAAEVKEQADDAKSDPPRTALSVIEQAQASLEADCGRDLPTIAAGDLEKMELEDADLGRAEPMLESIGLMARQCGSYEAPRFDEKALASCNPDCHWCPVKWYWCIENAGACVGGDNEACCKLGACGSKHHCETVCKSSCGCDVPPLPPDSGGGGDEE